MSLRSTPLRPIITQRSSHAYFAPSPCLGSSQEVRGIIPNSKRAFPASIQASRANLGTGWKRAGWQLTLGISYAFSYRSEENYIDFEKDYYQILGVDQKADLTQIKQKFYFLAKEYHPDKAKGHQAMFKTINEAYNILSQPSLRQDYDSNRNRDPKETTADGLANQAHPSKTLNYQPYSQMSRAQWAVMRQGYMPQSKVDYSNFKRTFNPEQDMEFRFKKAEQWNRVFRSLTKEQVLEEIQFRDKLEKKYLEDVRTQQEARQQFYEQKFRRIGDRIERAMGKSVRSLYDYWISK